MRGRIRKRRNTEVRGVSTVVLASHLNAFAAVLGQSFSFWIHVFAPHIKQTNKQTNQLYFDMSDFKRYPAQRYVDVA